MTDRSHKPAFYGRRKGHALRPRSADLMDTLLPRLALDLARPRDPRRLFSVPVGDVWLEIGFGGGEHMIDQARRHPDTGLIGCEPFVNGMAKALRSIDDGDIDTIRLHHGDAGDVIDWLPDQSVGRVFLLYPDPWPKRRHWKRRFVSAPMLDRLHRIMAPGAELRFASDIESYVAWTLERLRDHPGFAWTAEKADHWRRPWPNWPGTRYEAKSRRAGRVPTYLTFRRHG